MTKLQRLYAQHGQSPWLDNLTRGYLRDGTLARMVADGIRGVTANPTIFAKAIEGSADYDEQFSSLAAAGWSVEDAYWELVVADISAALAVLRPVFDAADGTDGFVSVEVAPELARDTKATIDAARGLHQRVDQPNLFVKIPATAQGVPAVEAMIAEGRSINITLIFSLTRYAEVIEAYLSGLEAFTAGGGDPARVHSVASFFVSRVDTEVDQRLEAIGTDEALELRGQAAVARPSSPTGCSPSGSPGRGGNDWPGSARTCSGRCGPRRPPRTPPIPTPCTSTSSSAPTPSTRCPSPRSPPSRTTAPWPAPSTPAWRTQTRRCAGWPPPVSTWTTSA
jgi:transaldolase